MKINDKHRIYLVCAVMFAGLCITGCGCTSQEESSAASMPAESITDGNQFTPNEIPPPTPDGTMPEGIGGPAPGGMDFTSAASTLGVTEEELMAALGNSGIEGEPIDLESVASALGVTVEQLQEVLGFTGEMPPDGIPPA